MYIMITANLIYVAEFLADKFSKVVRLRSRVKDTLNLPPLKKGDVASIHT